MTSVAYTEEESPIKKYGSIALTGLIMFLIVGGAYWYFKTTHPSNELSDHPQTERIAEALENPKTASYYKDFIPVETNSQNNVHGARSAPAFNVGRYTVATTLPFLPGQTKIYTFKNAFPEDHTLSLAQKLLAGDAKLVATKDGIRTYSSTFGYMIFNTTTGSFQLNSVGAQTPFEQLKTIADIRPALTAYLQNTLGVIDETATLTAYYQRNISPDVTYYEFHRDPQKIGLQIINPVGVANLPEDVPLKKVGLDTFTVDTASDPTIILASDTPGKARRNDFNTMTVGVNSAGAIVSIESNLRPIESSDFVTGLALNILSPDQALEELQKQGAYFSISVPSGQGTIDYDQVYAQNKLTTQEAVITDMTLSFIEKPAHIAQRYLQPVYIVRGYAETDTGVRVRFVQTIPTLSALADTTSEVDWSVYAAETEINIPCPDGSGTCTFETFKNTPTPIQSTPTPQPPVTNIPSGPSNTPPVITTDRCVLLNTSDEVVEEGRPIFVAGIGDVFYFGNLPTGPLVVPNTFSDPYTTPLDGDPSIASYAFEERIQNELITIGARIMRDDPSRIAYGSNGIDLKRLYGLSTDIQNLPSVTYGTSGVGEQALYWDHVANSLTLNRFNLDPILNHPTPLSDAGLSNETIWLARRNSHQLGVESRNYGNFRLDPRCRFLTTISPLIYFYPTKTTAIQFTFEHDFSSYIDPTLQKTLTFVADRKGNLNFNGILRSKLHYEYAHVTFDRPIEGWVVNAREVQNKVNHIAHTLKLNTNEATSLEKEVARAMTTIEEAEYVYVALINEATLTEKLPFAVSPKPNTTRRVHIYVEPISATVAQSLKPRSPQLAPVARSGFTVIELGTYVQH